MRVREGVWVGGCCFGAGLLRGCGDSSPRKEAGSFLGGMVLGGRVSLL